MRRSVCIPYRLNEVVRIWRQNGCPAREALIHYKHWLRRFAAYCETHSLDQRSELTQCGAEKFARWWRLHGSRRRGQLKHAMGSAHTALRAWAFVLTTLGESLPPWQAKASSVVFDPRFQPFADYLREVRGNKPSTIHLMLTQLMAFDAYRRARGTADKPIRLPEIDEYVVTCRRRYSRSTVKQISTNDSSMGLGMRVTSPLLAAASSLGGLGFGSDGLFRIEGDVGVVPADYRADAAA